MLPILSNWIHPQGNGNDVFVGDFDKCVTRPSKLLPVITRTVFFPHWGRKSLQRVVKRSGCKWRKFQAKRKTRVARASVSAWWFAAPSKGVGLSGQWSFMHADGTWPHNGVKFCKICHIGDVRGASANVNSRQQTSYTGEVSEVLPLAQRVYKARLATGDCRGQNKQ